jgi:hypothetical protein
MIAALTAEDVLAADASNDLRLTLSSMLAALLEAVLLEAVLLEAVLLLEELAHAVTARAAASAMPAAAADRRCRGRGRAGGADGLPITGDSLP